MNYVPTRFRIPIRFTKTESKVCHYLANGLTQDRIAEVMGIKYDTVREHTKNIRQKMHVESTMMAAVQLRCVGFGSILSLPDIEIEEESPEESIQRILL